MSCAYAHQYGLMCLVILQSQVLDALCKPDSRRVTESELVFDAISIILECFSKMDWAISTLLTSGAHLLDREGGSIDGISLVYLICRHCKLY